MTGEAEEIGPEIRRRLRSAAAGIIDGQADRTLVVFLFRSKFRVGEPTEAGRNGTTGFWIA